MAPARVGRLVFMVAIIIALRVLGISALLPVFSPYALTLSDSGFLVGLAFGGYGLTMAFMQVPLGSLSDRWGRRPVLLLGLTAYVAGNVLAWWAPTIQWLIIARLVEGAGAVSSVALALLTDAVGEERRTMSIAVAGIGAGVSFLLGIAFGPFVADAIGVPGLFLASAILGLVVMGLVAWWAPGGRPPVVGDDSAAAGFWQTLGDRRGVALDLAGFAMNATLAATMLALPLLLVGAPDEGIDGRYTREAYRLMLLVTVLIGGSWRSVRRGPPTAAAPCAGPRWWHPWCSAARPPPCCSSRRSGRSTWPRSYTSGRTLRSPPRFLRWSASCSPRGGGARPWAR